MSDDGNINVEALDESHDQDEDAELNNESNTNHENSKEEKSAQENQKTRLTRLPIHRIKLMMKADPDCNIVNPEAIYLVTKATEMFIEFLGKEAAKNTKKKTIMRKDVDAAIDNISHLCFLEGALE